MKKFAKITAFILLSVNLLTVTAFGRELVAVGQVVGLELLDGTVTVADFENTIGGAAKEAGLEIGDQIVEINGRRICCAAVSYTHLTLPTMAVV